MTPQVDDQDQVDRDLMQSHVAGDPQAFNALLLRHRQRLWAVALRTTGNPEDAADAVQDACLSAFRGAASFRGDARVTTWLHRIVVNACLDRARRQAVRPTVPMPEQPPADPRDRLEESETSLVVMAALATLPQEQRLAIVLVDLQSLSVEEAAAVLGVPPGTVKSRCSRGRARLAIALGSLRGPELRNPDAPAAVTPKTEPSTEGGTP